MITQNWRSRSTDISSSIILTIFWGVLTYSTILTYPLPGKSNILHVLAGVFILILLILYTINVIVKRKYVYMDIEGVAHDRRLSCDLTLRIIEDILNRNELRYHKNAKGFTLNDTPLNILVGNWFVSIKSLLYKRRTFIYVSLGPVCKENQPFIEILKPILKDALVDISHSASQIQSSHFKENHNYFRINGIGEDYKRRYQPGEKVVWCRHKYVKDLFWGTKAIVLETSTKRVKIEFNDHDGLQIRYVKAENLVPIHLVLWGER